MIPDLLINPVSKDYTEIRVKEFEDTSLLVGSKKISNPLYKFVFWLGEIIRKDFIQLKGDKEPLIVKISDLSSKLGISKQEIIKAESDNTLNELIRIWLEANHYKVSYSEFLEYKNKGGLEELRYLEYLADSLHFPLSELLEAKKQNRLQEVLSKAQEVENRCDTFETLHNLYEAELGSAQIVLPSRGNMPPAEKD
jgi:hypothetical protein